MMLEKSITVEADGNVKNVIVENKRPSSEARGTIFKFKLIFIIMMPSSGLKDLRRLARGSYGLIHA